MSSRRSSLIDHYDHPSFSSSLLEQIYRSFDQDQPDHSINDNNNYKKFRMNHHHQSCNYMEREKNRDDFRVNRFVLDQWMQNNNDKSNSISSSSINSVAKFNSSSSTSSSDSSSGIGGFSSSDTESVYNSSKSKMKPKIMTLKPIKTNVNPPEFHRKCYSDEIPAKKKEGNLQKRALKLYGDLKKVKQPISPGGKLASFLNSLFNSNASKKPKISTSTSSNGLKYSTSTPSTACSYSRSCLSKTPSSAGRFERRSVRFCPVNTVIAVANYDDDDNKVRERWRDNNTTTTTSSSRGHDHEELKVQIMEKHRRVEEVAKELLKNYHNGRKSYQNDVSSNNKNTIRRFKQQDVDDEDEDEDDDASCCSSDLFELEIGVDRRYREELPVYETTHVHTNRAIAKGFI